LLIACANVANLLLGLATGRRQEILIRAALGATRGRLIRQLLSESAILCAVGGMGGFLFASAVLAKFSQFKAPIPILGNFTLAANFRTNGTVLAMTLILIFIATLVTGLVPATYASSANVAGALSGEAVVGGTRKGFIRNALVVVQVAVCTLVVVGVGLCLRSLHNLQDVNLGFSPRNLVAVMIDAQSNNLSEAQGLNLYSELKRSASQLYGVQSSSLALEFPLIDDQWSTEEAHIEGARDGLQQRVQIPGNVVDGSYFATLGIPLAAGRTFDSSDAKNAPEVVVINHKMAETYWPGDNPIGKQFGTPMETQTQDYQIVGVVEDTAYTSARLKNHLMYFVPMMQRPVRMRDSIKDPIEEDQSLYAGALVLQTSRPMSEMEPLARRTLAEINPNLTVVKFQTFDAQIADRFTEERMIARLTMLFGGLALLLATIGLYGVTAYSVVRRTAEIGIRMALGAERAGVIAMVMRGAVFQTVLGLTIGVPIALLCVRFVKAQLYEVTSANASVLTIAIVTLAVAACVAGIIPARRAASIDPVLALRTE